MNLYLFCADIDSEIQAIRTNMSSTREMYKRMQAARKGNLNKNTRRRSTAAGVKPKVGAAVEGYRAPSLPDPANARPRVRSKSLGDALRAENATTKQSLHDLEITEKIVNNYDAENEKRSTPTSTQQKIRQCRREKQNLAAEVERAEQMLGTTSADVADAQEAVANAELNLTKAKLMLKRSRDSLKGLEEKAMVAAAQHMQAIHALRLVDKKLDALAGPHCDI